MSIIYSRTEDGLCGWCESQPAEPRTDAIGTTYLACAECFAKHALHEADRVAVQRGRRYRIGD